jgi:hypothetical protein
MAKLYIAIDPGANSGGIAWRDLDGRINADPMPESLTGICDYLRNLIVMTDPVCVLEKTGTFFPGNSGPAAVNFARHCGQLEAILYCLGIPTTQISPQTWQKPYNLPKDKKARKQAIKEMVQRKFPHIKVTLKTSDALLLLDYYVNKGDK